MISNDEQLNQAIDQLGGFYRALAALRRDVLPLNGRQFALLSEGPLEEIRKLKMQIDEYTGKLEAETNDSDVWLQIAGPSLTWPDAPTSVLTALLDAFRKGVQAVAEFISTGQLTTRPTSALKRACDLRIVAFQPGSIGVGLRVPDEAQSDARDQNGEPPVYSALSQYLQAAEWVGSECSPEELELLMPDAKTRTVVLNALKTFVPRPRGDVDQIEVSGRMVPKRTTIKLTKASHNRLDKAIDWIITETVEEHIGDLREIDLDNRTFILRNAEDVKEVRCSFDEDLLETAKEALDRRVQVSGIRRIEEGRRVAAVLRVIRLEIIDEDAPAQTVFYQK